MVISSDFRMGEHRDDDHEEDAPYFITKMILKADSDVLLQNKKILDLNFGGTREVE